MVVIHYKGLSDYSTCFSYFIIDMYGFEVTSLFLDTWAL